MWAEEIRMDVLLKETVEHLGKRGEVVKVADGYARNFLLPKGLAIAVDSSSASEIEAARRRIRKQEKIKEASVQGLAERLKGISLTISEKATEEGHLFGSVTAERITEELSKMGIELDVRNVVLEEPIKELGVYMIPIRLEKDITSELKLWVVA